MAGTYGEHGQRGLAKALHFNLDGTKKGRPKKRGRGGGVRYDCQRITEKRCTRWRLHCKNAEDLPNPSRKDRSSLWSKMMMNKKVIALYDVRHTHCCHHKHNKKKIIKPRIN